MGKKKRSSTTSRSSTDHKEKEANLFACRTLIPDTELARLKTLRYDRIEVIKRFSQEIGIAPAVVVGRLQHEDCLPYRSFMNHLKLKLARKNEATGAG